MSIETVFTVNVIEILPDISRHTGAGMEITIESLKWP